MENEFWDLPEFKDLFHDGAVLVLHAALIADPSPAPIPFKLRNAYTNSVSNKVAVSFTNATLPCNTM